MYVRYNLYIWDGINLDGFECHGQIMARNKATAKEILRTRKIVTRKISKHFSMRDILNWQPIKNKDLTSFTQQVAVVLESGFSFIQALKFANHYHNNYSYQCLLNLIISDVEAGMSFAKSIQNHKQVFNHLYCSLVEVGENSGSLTKIFARLAEYLQQTEDFKNRIRKLLFYPSLLIVLAIGVVTCILLVVMPQFQSLYLNFGSDLPLSSKILISFADYIRKNGFSVFCLSIVILIILKWLRATFNKISTFIDKAVFKIPFIGVIIRKIILARFINTLYLAYNSGISLIESLNHAKLVADNSCYRGFVDKVIIKVSAGFSLQKALDNNSFFPKHLVNVLSIGDDISNLEEMLKYLSTFYDKEIVNMLGKISNILEPLIMLFLGCVVGFLVLAIYYPIINLGAII